MTKSRSKVLAFKGQITAFLALIFILMLSVVGALIESASIQITKNRKRADTILALESTFAEYHPELLGEYEIFARVGGTEDVLRNRLSYYGADNMEHTVEQIQLLTDYNGAPFYQQAVRYMKNWLGVENLTSNSGIDFSENNKLKEKELDISVELESVLEEAGVELPVENNPLQTIENLKKSNLLSILVSDQEALSNRNITLETLPSGRELQRGNFAADRNGSTSDKLFFVTYVLEHFMDITNQKETKKLLYEQEYLLNGFSSDKENLEAVCKKIMNIRTALNYTYLLTDSARQAEAQAMALAMCTMIALPEIAEVVKHALLFAWAYGESILDTRALLKGRKIPLVKTSENWQLQLANLATLGTENEMADEKTSETGISYQDYMKGMLLLADGEVLSVRCLDLIESNLHIKADQCMTKVEIESTANLRRGVQETFQTTFGYQ